MHPILAFIHSFYGFRNGFGPSRGLIQRLHMHHDNKHHQGLFQLGLYRAFGTST